MVFYKTVLKASLQKTSCPKDQLSKDQLSFCRVFATQFVFEKRWDKGSNWIKLDFIFLRNLFLMFILIFQVFQVSSYPTNHQIYARYDVISTGHPRHPWSPELGGASCRDDSCSGLSFFICRSHCCLPDAKESSRTQHASENTCLFSFVVFDFRLQKFTSSKGELWLLSRMC